MKIKYNLSIKYNLNNKFNIFKLTFSNKPSSGGSQHLALISYNQYMFGTNSISNQRPKAGYET